MTLMLWSKHFETGIEVIDTQHRQLVDLINGVAPHLAESGEATLADSRPLLDDLAQYAVMHFRTEESLMRAGGIDPGYLAGHVQTHAAFVDEVGQMIQASHSAVPLSGTQLLRFLTSWLTFHILAEDQKMARQLREIASGVTPATAAASITRENASANAVLNEALVDLFGLVTQRNQNLKSLNEALTLTKEELAIANEQLEARVAERTRQLSGANAALEAEHHALLESLEQVTRTQAQLVQSEKMAAIGQLAAGVAHEINNPIGFVTSNVNALADYTDRLLGLIDAYEDHAPPPAEAPPGQAIRAAREAAELDYLRKDLPELLDETRSGLARVTRIVSALREFTTIGDDIWQAVDINAVLENALSLTDDHFRETITIRREFGRLPRLIGAPAQLSQVFMSLLVNAAQAIKAEGTVTIRTYAEDDEIRIEIEDTGDGIPDSMQHRIFEPFYSSKPVGEGTGLGLSMAWEIVKRHQGRIDFNTRPEKGTTFIVSLPAAPEVAAEDMAIG